MNTNTLIINDLTLFNEPAILTTTTIKVKRPAAIRAVKTQTESFLFVQPSTHGKRVRNQKLRTECKELLKLVKNQNEVHRDPMQIGFNFVLPLFNVAPIQPQKTEKVKKQQSRKVIFTECNQINLF